MSHGSGANRSRMIQGPLRGRTGWWPMRQGTGTTARDESGNADGTLTNGPTWDADQGNYALNLDGTDDYVNIGTGLFGVPAGATAISLCAWVKVDAFTAYPAIIGKLSNTSPYGGWGILSTTGPDGFLFAINKSGTWTLLFSTAQSTGAWILVVATYDGTTMRLYINGTENATNATSGTIQYQNETTAGYLGRNDTSYFNGMIAEASIYNRTLSAEEIAWLYKKGRV